MTGAIAKILNEVGFGFDVVSIGEIYTLLNSGIDLSKTSFNFAKSETSPIIEVISFSISKILKREGSVGGSSEYPTILAPKFFNILQSHEPLNPV